MNSLVMQAHTHRGSICSGCSWPRPRSRTCSRRPPRWSTSCKQPPWANLSAVWRWSQRLGGSCLIVRADGLVVAHYYVLGASSILAVLTSIHAKQGPCAGSCRAAGRCCSDCYVTGQHTSLLRRIPDPYAAGNRGRPGPHRKEFAGERESSLSRAIVKSKAFIEYPCRQVLSSVV